MAVLVSTKLREACSSASVLTQPGQLSRRGRLFCPTAKLIDSFYDYQNMIT